VTPDQEKDLLGTAALGIAALRAWCGAWFVLMAVLKLPLTGGAWEFPRRLERWLAMAAEKGAHPQYRPLMEWSAKHADAVTGLVTFAEGAIGLLLLVGLFTRLASAGAVLLCANYWLASARLGFTTTGVALTIGVTACCLWIGNAGMFYGLDGVRARRKPTSLAPPMGAARS
jgi:uncharacterized membrane protein YphA (DoxX/SURF4 family)